MQSIKVRRNALAFQLHNVGAQFNSASEWLATRDFSHLFVLRVASHAGLCHAFLPHERLCNGEGTRDKFKFKLNINTSLSSPLMGLFKDSNTWGFRNTRSSALTARPRRLRVWLAIHMSVIYYKTSITLFTSVSIKVQEV